DGWSTPLGEAMLAPTKIYVQPVLDLLEKIEVHGIVHITGGGFYENIPRILPEGTKAVIERNSWPVAPIFALIQERAQIEEREMFTTFNMGIGLTIFVAPENAAAAQQHLSTLGAAAHRIGTVESTPETQWVELR